jgi:hypothetical protein
MSVAVVLAAGGRVSAEPVVAGEGDRRPVPLLGASHELLKQGTDGADAKGRL